jgi:hypothetical protein
MTVVSGFILPMTNPNTIIVRLNDVQNFPLDNPDC